MERTTINQVTGEQITFIETAEDTNGEYLLIEVVLPPYGKGPPLHIHDRFDEEFEVISGKLTIILGKAKHTLGSGDRRIAWVDTPHTFMNNDDGPVTFRVRLTSPSQFEESVRIHYGLIADGLTDHKGNPKSLAYTALILSLQNTLIIGIPCWIQRYLCDVIVKRARRRGTYIALEKYIGRRV
ncbi:cupin domain-containing protein [Paenibacillus sp. CMAA1364]